MFLIAGTQPASGLHDHPLFNKGSKASLLRANKRVSEMGVGVADLANKAYVLEHKQGRTRLKQLVVLANPALFCKVRFRGNVFS